MEIISLQIKIYVSLISSLASKLPIPCSYQNMRDKVGKEADVAVTNRHIVL